MKELLIGIGLIVLGAAVLLVGDKYLEQETDQPKDGKIQIDLNLDSALSDVEMSPTSRMVWAGMLEGIGRFVIADGRSDDPVLATVYDVEDLRDATLSAPVVPVDGGKEIGAILAPYLADLGTKGEELTSARRQAIGELFLGAGQALAGV